MHFAFYEQQSVNFLKLSRRETKHTDTDTTGLRRVAPGKHDRAASQGGVPVGKDRPDTIADPDGEPRVNVNCGRDFEHCGR